MAIVADGMGGHQGEIASHIAVDAVKDCPVTSINTVSRTAAPGAELANERVYRRAAENADYRGMGTTVVMACFTPQVVYVAHVGDSRAYLWHEGRFVS